MPCIFQNSVALPDPDASSVGAKKESDPQVLETLTRPRGSREGRGPGSPGPPRGKVTLAVNAIAGKTRMRLK